MNKNSSVKLEKIIKRNERIENFDSDKIYRAILKAGKATKEFDESIAKTLTIRSINMAEKILRILKDPVLLNRMKKQASLSIGASFALSRMLEETEALYRKVI